MATQETLIERLIPGDLERTVPAKLRQALPGGLRNRLVQAALGLLVAFGFAFVVRSMLRRREARRVPMRQPATALPGAMEAAIDAPPSFAPASRTLSAPPESARHALLARPHVALSGPVDSALYARFREQLAAAPLQGALVVSLATPGGDWDVARVMGDDIRLMREQEGRELLFLGKVMVCSAGVAVLAAFPSRSRFLARGTQLLIEAQAEAVALSGALGPLAAGLRTRLDAIEHSARMEDDRWRALAAGSRIGFEQLRERAAAGWHLDADAARELGLVADVI